MTAILNRIPMDLTDPYYGQFYPGGTVAVQRARDVGLHDLHGRPGTLGTFNLRPKPVYIPPVEYVAGERVAAALRRLRTRYGMTQKDVAIQMGICSDTRVSHIETQRYDTMHPRTVKQLAGAFDLTVPEFLAYANTAENPTA